MLATVSISLELTGEINYLVFGKSGVMICGYKLKRLDTGLAAIL
jgi:hypothetical protein